MSLARLVLGLTACAASLVCAAPAQATYDSHLNLPYGLGGTTALINRLDLYTPSGPAPDEGRPLVVYVHGGGWMRGDKSNRIADKASLFTGLDYVFASVNYRLSPDPPNSSDPDRVRFPAQPNDVGEALGWLDRNAADYGADPERMLLIGHSAGAQIISLVATDPTYVAAFGVEPWQIAGAVSLDTDAFDIAEQATQTDNPQNRALIWNAFATPAENAASPVYNRASALAAAGPKDPEMLLVTGNNPRRIAANRAMAIALGQDPADVLRLNYSHEQINTALGSPDDTAHETYDVTTFLERALAGSVPPRVKLTGTPPKRVHSGKRTAKVRFRFTAKPNGSADSFECRLDGERWDRCKSPIRLRAECGRHEFRVRALSGRGQPGEAKSFSFRVVRR